MSTVRLRLPRLTLDWLNSQPDGCATAVSRILKEALRPSRDETESPGVRLPTLSKHQGLSPEALELMSVHIMKAHIADLLSKLAQLLGRDDAQALAFQRCAPDLSLPVLDCWMTVVANLHELHQEHCSNRGLPAA
jgi:hypothetical protein